MDLSDYIAEPDTNAVNLQQVKAGADPKVIPSPVQQISEALKGPPTGATTTDPSPAAPRQTNTPFLYRLYSVLAACPPNSNGKVIDQ